MGEEVLRQPNPFELAFREQAEAEGWDVTKRGWPDFLCRRNGELMAVEVKGPHDGLSAQQYETISDLRRAGIPTFVWSPDQGYTQVGPPVGESVFSLKATIVQLRRLLTDMHGPKEADPADLIQWVYDESDPEAMSALRRECLRGHGHHQRWKKLGNSGSWCTDVVILARRYSAEQILAMAEMHDLRLMRRNIERGQRYLYTYQHNRLHATVGPSRCTGCEHVA